MLQVLIMPTNDVSRTTEASGDNWVETTLTTGATFRINSAKLYVLAVIFSTNNSIKFLEHIKQGYRWTISWN